MKEIIDKAKVPSSNFPDKLVVEHTEVKGDTLIATEFNNYFANVGRNLASKIEAPKIPFTNYLKKVDSYMPFKSLTVNELKDAFFSLKANKSPGHDDINSNVIRKCFNELIDQLKFLFNLSLEEGIFPDDLKIAKVTPIFKEGDKAELGNYRPISVLPCFSKVLERIMYNRFYTYVKENKILYSKQFGFQSKHSTDQTILESVDQLYDSFEKNKYIIGIFIDLSKAFDTVYHSILLKKLEFSGVSGINLKWFKSYLSNRKQYISINNFEKTNLLGINCGVPQGSILGPLLFLLYVNDLRHSSNLLEPVMFADDTNLFYSHQSISHLFAIANLELQKVQQWFISNKLSLNVKKTKYTLFHKTSKKNDIPKNLPSLLINERQIKRENYIKFLGVFLDENLTWKEHIKYTENKISKSIGLLYKAKPYLNKDSLLLLYFSYIHSYINYGNIAWGSTYKTNLKKLLSKQKHAIRIVFDRNMFDHTKELFKTANILNVYQLNLLKNVTFMHQVKNKKAPSVFLSKFKKPSHQYPTNFSSLNFSTPFSKLQKSNHRISIRGPYLWNNFLHKAEKEIENIVDFENKIKLKLLTNENELDFF